MSFLIRIFNTTAMRLFYSLTLLFYSMTLAGQMTTYQAVSTSQIGGRYEILQSEIFRKLFFKLDKFTGTVYECENQTKYSCDWKEVHRITTPMDSTIKDKINYQLYLGGHLSLDCFLLNIFTGATWIYTRNKENGSYFELYD